MTLQSIDIPEDIKQLAHDDAATNLIALGHERIEAFMQDNDSVTENFVRCDFHLLDQALTWIEQNHLLTGRRFCELGSGFGVAAMLASLHGLESVGIEVESYLVDQASDLADELDLPTAFYCGSFVPRGVLDIEQLGSEVEHVETHEDDVYEEIGLAMDDFDLFFAFPWPGEEHFFEAVFEAGAAVNSLLLTFRGRDGMGLLRKV
ncbi:methyltransferase domain-containing protein [Mariniblastus fucicola]|uniref:Methyltransferase n=1 Tax=Mariniblastus fucicola TaxID=980251 RepID=A0A5B9PBR9_9BACT|nr:hypothetical protein [Mariniblastus fucicola]QEG22362.1 hypothetical protein MFFC18_22420 [Mariniblastus fucicola]